MPNISWINTIRELLYTLRIGKSVCNSPLPSMQTAKYIYIYISCVSPGPNKDSLKMLHLNHQVKVSPNFRYWRLYIYIYFFFIYIVIFYSHNTRAYMPKTKSFRFDLRFFLCLYVKVYFLKLYHVYSLWRKITFCIRQYVKI